MNWKTYENERVFVQLRSGTFYNGIIVDVDDSDPQIVFLTIIDKFGSKITFVHSEISHIKITPSATSRGDAFAKDAVILGTSNSSNNGVRGAKTSHDPHNQKGSGNRGDKNGKV